MPKLGRTSLRVQFSFAMIGAACALTSGALIASNMGHIATVHLQAEQSSGLNTINLPYDIGPSITTAKALMDDIGFTKIANVQRFIETTNAYEVYTGRKGSPNADFPLAPGECYFVSMITSTDYTIVGSERPSISLSLEAPAPGTTRSNFVSLPFNSTFTTAKALMDDIGFANIANVQRYIKSTNSFEVYTGRKGSPNANFSIAHDECYFVSMISTVSSYPPTHY